MHFTTPKDKALTLKGKAGLFSMKECTQTEGIGELERPVDEEDKAHDNTIAINDQQVSGRSAKDKTLNHGRFLRRRKMISTAKARAFIHIIRKGRSNVEDDALMDDQEDVLAMEDNRKWWDDFLIEVQVHLEDGDEEAIELILAKMIFGGTQEKMEQ